MDWIILIGVVVIVAVLLLIKRMAFIPETSARQHLANGAIVVDVRSPQEFSDDRVRGAINIPLGELEAMLPKHVKDKNQVLLLHCLSGGRSSLAQQQLKRLGYTKVFNLGSLGRAKAIVEKQ